MSGGTLELAPPSAESHRLATALVAKQVSSPSAALFAAGKRPGRTAEGEPCPCTDPPPMNRQEEKWYDPVAKALGLIEDEKNPDKVLQIMRQKQMKAEIGNADTAMSKALKAFNTTEKAYKKAYDKANSAFDTWHKKEERYEKAFWAYKAAHAQHCTPLVQGHEGVKIKCERDFRDFLEAFFARRHMPQCLVGDFVRLDTPPEKVASAPAVVAILAGPCKCDCGTPCDLRRRTSMPDRVSEGCVTRLCSFL